MNMFCCNKKKSQKSQVNPIDKYHHRSKSSHPIVKENGVELL